MATKGAATKDAVTKDAVTKDAVTKDKDAASTKAAPQATPKTQLKPPVMQDDTQIQRLAPRGHQSSRGTKTSLFDKHGSA